jgi:hypothetical protein
VSFAQSSSALLFRADGPALLATVCRDIAEQFQNWVKNRWQKWGVPILDAPDGRRDDFVDPYFKHAKKDDVVVNLNSKNALSS